MRQVRPSARAAELPLRLAVLCQSVLAEMRSRGLRLWVAGMLFHVRVPKMNSRLNDSFN